MRNFFMRVKFKLLSIFLGRGFISIYRSHIHNCNSKNYTTSGEPIHLNPPIYNSFPERVVLEPFTRIQSGVQFIMNHKQSVVIKKYSSISAKCVIIPGAHTPTVGLPQHLSYLGINDKDSTLVIHEDVWVAARCTLLTKATMGRGSIAGAGSLIAKPVPPYAVVGGVPAKIIAVRFTIDQILAHEEALYPPDERLSRTTLEELFQSHYQGLRAIGTSHISPQDMELLSQTKEQIGIYNPTK